MATQVGTLDEVLIGWRRWKSRIGGRHLAAPCVVEHEYRGKQWGHPSTYAFVRLQCAPAEELGFEMRARWPSHLTPDYCQLLHDAIGAAIVDELVSTEDPHGGCRVTCIEVKWDDVTSSERAFYRATRAAMITLREREWTVRTKA